MRPGILLPPLAGPAAGLGVYVGELASRLVALEPETTLFTVDDGGLPSWCARARTVRLGRGGVLAALRRLHPRLARLAAVQTALRRELGRRPIDALLVPFHDGVYRCPVPQVVTVHDLTLLRYPPPGAQPAAAYLRLVFRNVARTSAAVISVSASTRDDLCRLWGIDRQRVRIIHEGYDRRLFRAFTDAEQRRVRERHGLRPPYLFYAGTLSPHKNLGTAIAAVALLAERYPDLSLAVAGPATGIPPDLEREIRGRGLEARVRLLGYVDREDLGPLMAAAAAFVFPSLQEGFGLAVVEAMASAAAVLASNRASLPEVVGGGGRLLDPGRPADWAAAIEALLARPETSRRLRQAALAQAARFDWDRAARETLETLRALGGERPAQPGSSRGALAR